MPVLSIGKLLPGSAAYYLGTVASGAEDYYLGHGESPGQWCGRSAGRLGLEGEVDAEALHRLLDHEHPATGERLTRGHSVPTVVGYDATFCAPKSVSLLYGLGDPETSNEVRNAHDTATAKALGVFEGVAQGRRGAGGHQLVGGDGFVAAAFRHRTSRAMDPHLHTHVVVANVVYAAEDDRWSALDGRPVYQWCLTVGHLYGAQLRYELTRRLGVGWQPVENGLADIEGIAPPVLDAFSTRRADIEADLDASGRTGAKAAQDAVYFTRPKKETGVDTADLFAGWREQADALGFDAPALAATLHRAGPIDVPCPGSPDADELYWRLAAPDGLTEKASTFGRREVIEAICELLPAGGQIEDILKLTDGFLESAHVIGLGTREDIALTRRNGSLVPSGRDEDRYSTPEMILVEQRLLAGAARRRHDHAGVASGQAITGALAMRPTISDEQRAMIDRVCTSGAGVDLVGGVAGSGKTYALAAANDAWTASGFTVSGVCLAAKAARRLEQGSAIASTTLDSFLLRIERTPLGPTDVVVVDEAAMVGTRKLEQLLNHAEATGAKMVLTGDPFQLPEIDAGGAFVGLARRLGTVELTENRRQHEPWERDALGELRNGDTDVAVDSFLGHGRIHTADTIEELCREMVEQWWDARQRGERALMCAPTLRQVDQLNRLARSRLATEGQLDADRLYSGGRHYAVGDRVLALRNDRRLGVLNGTEAVITGFDFDRRTLPAAGEDGPLSIPFDYVETHLTHAYATTIHKAQGATVDRTLVLADDTARRETLYTALSRGTMSNDVYMTVADWRDEYRHANEPEIDPVDALANAARRSAAKHLAIEGVDDRWTPVEALQAERDHLQTVLRAKPADPTLQLQSVQTGIRVVSPAFSGQRLA